MALADGLLGYWSPWLGSSGYRLLDRSVRGSHGTLTNMDAGTDWVGATIRGRSGYVLDFDGVNDYVPITTLNLYSYTTNDCCVLAWIFPRSTTRNAYLADWNSAGSAETFRLEMSGFSMTSGRIGGSILATASATPVQTSSAPSLNTWHCLALQRSGTTQQLFWNGVLDASNTTAVSATAAANPIVIGRGGNANILYANCQIAETVILRRALSAQEHLELFRLGLGWYRPTPRSRIGFATVATTNRRRRILCGDYS